MRFTKYPLIIFLSSIFLSCVQTKNTNEIPVESAPKQQVTKKEVTTQTGPAFSGIFSVDDIEKWKDVYNSEVAEETQIAMLQSIENENLLFVIQWSDGHEKAMEMLASQDAKKIIKDGTINSEIQFRYFDIVYVNPDTITDSLRLAVDMEVMNYKMWKSDFDRDEQYRIDAQLVLTGLAIDAFNDNLIYMIFATNDKQKVYDMMNSPELKQAVYESGVIGEPNVSWWRVPKE